MSNLNHQNPFDLERALNDCLSRDVFQTLAGVSPGHMTEEALRENGRKLCEVLLEYCSYQIAPVEDVDPFDDPYVGAALVTTNGVLIGAHRKESRHEPHAEAATLLAALRTVGTDEAIELVDNIDRAYSHKVWLRGDDSVEGFVKLFQQAGNIVRHQIESESPGVKLILLSTLEPCRDFETQPSCSRLIAAFRPDVVFYACDDTNAKGQGRPVLLREGLRVVENVAPERNIQVNLLFYSSVHYLKRLHGAALESPNRFEIYYVIAHLDRLRPDYYLKDERLHIMFDRDVELPVHQVSIGPRAPKPLSETFGRPAVDPQRVLFINSLSYDFLAFYFQRHFISTGKIPGIIISSQSPEKGQKTRNLIRSLQKIGVRIYTDVMRRADEQFLALQSIRRWKESRSSGHELYLLVKEDNGYSSFAGRVEDAVERLLMINAPRRVVLFINQNSYNVLVRFVMRLKNISAFEPPRELSVSSFFITLVTKEEQNTYREIAEIKDFLRSEDLLLRFSITTPIRESEEQLSADILRRELISGRLDAINLDVELLQSLLDSPTWKGRQAAGLFLDAAARRDPILFRELIVKKLNTRFDPTDWRRTCSLLNAIAKFGPAPDVDAAYVIAKLAQLGEGLELAISENHPTLMDVVWRFTAAALSVAKDAQDIQILLGNPNLVKYIGQCPFLLKELFFYASRSSLAAAEAIELAFSIIETQSPLMESAALADILLRVTRHAVLWKPDFAATAQARIGKLLKDKEHIARLCDEEYQRCLLVLSEGLSGVFSRGDDKGRTFSSYLFIRTASTNEHEQGLFAAVQREITNALSSRLRHGEEPVSWRGDKTALARLALSEVPIRELFSFLEAMASDEDDTIRWAGLVLAMDRDIRSVLLDNPSDKKDCFRVRRSLARVVTRVIEGKPHYWLQREFLHLFNIEHAGGNPLPLTSRLQMIDVPLARALIFDNLSTEYHPEVVEQRELIRAWMRRVALILPPMNRDPDALDVSSSTTPALGLGSIASFLLSHGHDVILLDCHRFPALANEIPNIVRDYDAIGFGVVTSTFQSTERLVAELKTALGSGAPKVILGGHAVTLHPNDFVKHSTFQWDYLILGDGEHPFLDIINNDAESQIASGVIQRMAETKNLSDAAHISSEQWNLLPWIERRVFMDLKGDSYEPGFTRGGIFREAHIVMSRGCAWKCTFCTEAILRGKDGEVRRSPEDVVDEIEWLVENDGVNRIQFVDDNLLPQIAARGVEKQAALVWAVSLLEGLVKIRKHGAFGWRGIFRFEDFIEYEERLPKWLQMLEESGCLLLAFGVEHGLEEQRVRLKGGSVTNKQIESVISRLTKQGIATKGYFIVGGENEDNDSTDHSIDLAISADFTLAYFALYKNFRELIRLSKRDEATIEWREETFMKFNNLLANFDEIILSCNTPRDCFDPFGQLYDLERIREAQDSVNRLRELGFRFDDLFKYNDFHDNIDIVNDSLSVWKATNESITKQFLQSVRRAYFEFYARPAFVEKYRWLIGQGY